MHPVPGTADASLNVSTAYDRIAGDYDAQVRGDDWMRQRLHAHYRAVFRAGERVLDVGCGTGIDALALASSGIRVLGVDASPRMIEQLRSRVAAAGLQHLVSARVGRIEELADLDEAPFDGLIAAFASLNTLPDLSAFSRYAARLVRPRGRLVVHLLNRFSLWEFLGHLSHGNVNSARQVGGSCTRLFTIGGERLQHTLYFGESAYRRYFSNQFALRQRYSLGALRPPHTVRRIPSSVVTVLEWLDVRSGGLPVLRDIGRFCVLDLERLPG